MASIEAITAQTGIKKFLVDGKVRLFRVKQWNGTVANLTLMALGSSAPEILLSIIELISNDMHSGELGPSTIVGSAAFNLFCIVAVCVVAIPADDTRIIMNLRVYSITAITSILAYIWLAIILIWSSPDVIELWEALITFFAFPVLVCVAYWADKWKDAGWRRKHPLFRHFTSSKVDNSEQTPSVIIDIKNPDGSALSTEEIAKMVKQLKQVHFQQMSEEDAVKMVTEKMIQNQPKSRSYYRVNAVRTMFAGRRVTNRLLLEQNKDQLAELSIPKDELIEVGSGPPSPNRSPFGSRSMSGRLSREASLAAELASRSYVGFASQKYAVIECAAKVTISVIRTGVSDFPLTVHYKTCDGSAKAGSDYHAAEGTVEFAADQTNAEISILIVDDNEPEPNKSFTVDLSDVQDNGKGTILAPRGISTNITIIDDDVAGTFVFPEEYISVSENAKQVLVRVNRENGNCGNVSLQYRTLDGTAIEGKDYIACSGTLQWEAGDSSPRFVVIQIIGDDCYERDEHFELEIHTATGQAVFDRRTDGSEDRSIARITITGDTTVKHIVDRAIALIGYNAHMIQLSSANWRSQFSDAVTVGVENPSVLQRIGFGLALPWKLFFAIIPPTTFCGGYLCFFVSLFFIGLLTAFVGDLSNLLGCCLGIEASVIAITFVALGTSLPDTFASKSAAVGDPVADAAIGNVTGSNSVNVFLGLGLSWVVGAIYWNMKKINADWMGRYDDIADSYKLKIGDKVGLAVPAGDLGFSVSVFSVLAIACIVLLAIRRKVLGYELGGRYRWPTATVFVSLWCTYLALVIGWPR